MAACLSVITGQIEIPLKEEKRTEKTLLWIKNRILYIFFPFFWCHTCDRVALNKEHWRKQMSRFKFICWSENASEITFIDKINGPNSFGVTLDKAHSSFIVSSFYFIKDSFSFVTLRCQTTFSVLTFPCFSVTGSPSPRRGPQTNFTLCPNFVFKLDFVV